MNLQILIPMSGQGTRYRKAGYEQPKPMIPVNGTPMIERLLEKIPLDWPCTFVIAENHLHTGLPELLKTLRPSAVQVIVPIHKEGPSFAIKAALSYMSAKDPVLVSYCDYGLIWDPWDFKRFVQDTQCDAALISYRGFHAHYLSPVPYAYSRMENGFVKEVKEKGSFTNDRESEFASAGAYYFKSVEKLADAISFQEKKNLSMNGEYYTSLTTEALLQSSPNANVKIYEIPYFFQWGTPEDLWIFEYWEKTFKNWLALSFSSLKVDQVLMPMAGLGSRFKDQFKKPKPFLTIDGLAMYRHALDSLPRGRKTSFITLESVKDILSLQKNENAVFLQHTPSGQALSVEAGLSLLDSSGDIIVSACDHSIILSPQVWDKFHHDPDCDAAIFTVTNFPGAQRRPEAFAYVAIENTSDLFPLVKKVSVKKPISNRPSKDPLLVGTFWFKNKSILEKGLRQLIANDARVNGELYLDSIFDVLIALGKKVRIIPLDGYINWGDPDSLSEALYWKEVFGGHRNHRRLRFSGVEG